MKKILCLISLLTLSINTAFADDIVTNKKFNAAVKNGDLEFVKANIKNLENINSATCFLCTAAEKNQDDILNLLLENNANPDCPDSKISPLYTAVVFNNNYAVEKLLTSGANPNNKTNLPIIYLAIANDNAFAVQKLLESGADYNVTFMKIKALTLAFCGTNPEIEQVFIDYWNKRFETPPTDVNEALKILKNSKNGNKYYKILAGDNLTGKPFKILFCDIDKMPSSPKTKMINRYNSVTKQNYIYIDNSYRDIKPEVLAVLLAGESINIDGKSSVTETLVSFGIIANIWNEIISENPQLNDETNTIIKGYNGCINILKANDGRFSAGDYNNLWVLSGIATAKNRTSKGYKNLDLNSYFK